MKKLSELSDAELAWRLRFWTVAMWLSIAATICFSATLISQLIYK